MKIRHCKNQLPNFRILVYRNWLDSKARKLRNEITNHYQKVIRKSCCKINSKASSKLPFPLSRLESSGFIWLKFVFFSCFRQYWNYVNRLEWIWESVVYNISNMANESFHLSFLVQLRPALKPVNSYHDPFVSARPKFQNLTSYQVSSQRRLQIETCFGPPSLHPFPFSLPER